MKVILLTLSYSEKGQISFYEELLQEFAANGHECFVACPRKTQGEDTALSLERGIHVLRILTGNISGSKNFIKKGIATLTIDSYFKNAIEKYYPNEKFDLILYPTPPITLVGTISYLKKRCNAVTYLLLKDIFPQNAVDLGLLSKTGPKAIIYRMFRNKEKYLYRISDHIGCMSPANVKYLLSHNPQINPDIVEVCPNCVKVPEATHSSHEHEQIRKKYNIPVHKKVFIYGGNLGKPQGIAFFLSCLEACKDIDDAFFLVVGAGSEANRIKEYIKSNAINNTMFLDYLSKEDYELLTDACDVGLVFLDYRFTIPNFPSRVLSYMKKSKAVIVASDPVSDLGDIVHENGFGWKCLSNNTDKFRACVIEALSSNLEEMGSKGKIYLENNYTVHNGYEIIIKHFDW